VDQLADIKQASVSAPANTPVYFRSDYAGCPDADHCIKEKYLIEGDELFVSTITSDWTCGWSIKHGAIGWLPTKNLKISSIKSVPKLSDWTGVWTDGGNGKIKIGRKNGNLLVSGSTAWTNGTVVHTGGFSGKSKPTGDLLMLSEDDENLCAVRLRLISGLLYVADNGRCGGANVNFDGVYGR